MRKVIDLKSQYHLEYFGDFFAHDLSTLYPLSTNDKCEKLSTPKLNIICNILTLFLAHKLSTIRPLLINSKCENLPTL
jgi:hypothetical protein